MKPRCRTESDGVPGRGSLPSISYMDLHMEIAVSSPSGVRGEAAAAKRFSCVRGARLPLLQETCWGHVGGGETMPP